MINIFKDKRGEFLLRNMLILILLFSVVMALISIFVIDMADTYGNANMSAEFQGTDISTEGDTLFTGLSGNVSEMKNLTSNDGLAGFQTIGTGAKAVGTIIKIIFYAPSYFGNSVASILEMLAVPSAIANLIGGMISVGLYILVIFTILQALLRGPKL